MNKFLKYLELQFKRAVKVYPVILIFTLILTLCAALLLSNMLTNDANSESKQKLRIGIVGDLGDSFLNIGVETVQNFDSSKYYVSFESVENEETAQKLLIKNEYEGYLIIPETFLDSLSSSSPDSLIYVSKNTPNALTPMLIEELVSIVSDFLLESEKGILGVEDIAHEYDVKIDMYDAHMRFINDILARDEIYEVKQTGIGNGVGFANYYIFAFIMLLLLLFGISGCVFLIKKDMALPRLLLSKGYSSPLQILGDYIPFFAMIAFNLILVILALSFLPDNEIYKALYSAIDTPMRALVTAVMLLPAAALISSMQFFIYELCSNTISAVLSQLLSAIALSYVSGYLYPLSALPKAIQSFSRTMPTGTAFKYAISVFTGDVTFALVFIILIYTVFFLALSCAVREHKIRRNPI